MLFRRYKSKWLKLSEIKRKIDRKDTQRHREKSM